MAISQYLTAGGSVQGFDFVSMKSVIFSMKPMNFGPFGLNFVWFWA